jgi:hypothetical protein
MNARPDERSRLIASYLGPTAIVVAASEALNLRIWAVGSPPLTYLAGSSGSWAASPWCESIRAGR